MRALEGFSGVLQVDGYAGYKALADAKRRTSPLDFAFCWAHWRRDFFDHAKGGNAPVAEEALKRIGALYTIEESIRGKTADERRRVREAETAPLLDDLFTWLAVRLERLPQKSELAETVRYGIKRRAGLSRFVGDGRIEIDNNAAHCLA